MGAFNTKETLLASPSLIPMIADRICETFAQENYEVNRENLFSGGIDISISKGGIFKAVLGMKTALKITLVPQNNDIVFEAGVGIFGQQVIPSIITLFFAWPVLITQIWGLVQQSKLDDKALDIAKSVISEKSGFTPPPVYHTYGAETSKFCTNCGTRLSGNPRFCSNCGSPVN